MRIYSLTLALLLSTLVNYPSMAYAKSPLKIREINLTNANNSLEDPSLVIQKMSVKELTAEEVVNEDIENNVNTDSVDVKIPYLNPNLNSNRYSLKNALIVIDSLIAIGTKLVPLIEKGRPIYSSKNMDAISVIPNVNGSDGAFSRLSNWSLPATKHYKVNFTNLYGIDVVSFVYSVTFQYGGNFEGRGKYLTGVRVATRDVKVLWGFDVDAHSELIQISNVGSATNVIAGATVEITYTVGNILNVISTSESFHVTGDGRIFKLD